MEFINCSIGQVPHIDYLCYFSLGRGRGGFQSREWISCRQVIDLGAKLGFETNGYLTDNSAIEYSVQTLKRDPLSFQFLTMA
jgi:hypothetical protein